MVHMKYLIILFIGLPLFAKQPCTNKKNNLQDLMKIKIELEKKQQTDVLLMKG